MRLPLEGAVEQSETEGVNFARRKWYEGWDIIELLPQPCGLPCLACGLGHLEGKRYSIIF